MNNHGKWHLDHGDALDHYQSWDTPDTIISDGAYGVGGFPGDPRTPDTLDEWYEPHIAAWSEKATLATTLWFWNTEVGWATVHPILKKYGWQYEELNIWDKGVGQVAGNVNSKTIRRFPVVTEVCAFYTREPRITSYITGETTHMKRWLLDEWLRSGLPKRQANEACGVKDVVTRKYFDQGWLWYWPSVDRMMSLVEWANEKGDPAGYPYYSLDGKNPVTAEEWAKTRSGWTHEHGVTNVWQRPSLRGNERFKGSMVRSAPRTYKPTKMSASHLNQKPLDLMERIIKASTTEGDTVWEPFGGLCSASVAAVGLGRNAFAAERDENFYALANKRLNNPAQTLF